MSLMLDEDMSLNLKWQPPKLPSLSMLTREQANNRTLAELVEEDERQKERSMYMRTFGTEFL